MKYLNFLLLIIVCDTLIAQIPPDSIVLRASMMNNLFPRERVFLHFDNTGYYLGETMWFKAYVTGGERNKTGMSKVLYVELVAPEGYVVETKKYKIDNGVCNGEFYNRQNESYLALKTDRTFFAEK